MSRGYGIVQRRILAQLTEAAKVDGEGWTPLIELAADRRESGWSLVTSRGVTRQGTPWKRRYSTAEPSRYESARRAVSRLTADGVVETKWIEGTVPQWGYAGWAARKMLLHVRLAT
jgi:hypothetical protein